MPQGIDSGAAGFVQTRPFDLWSRMRVGPRIPSCWPSNGRCEPTRSDLLNAEFLTGSMLQGLSVHRAKCNEKDVFRAIMISIRLRAFVILCLQFHRTEKVVQLRKVIHCIAVPSLFGEFYEIFDMKTREQVRSSALW